MMTDFGRNSILVTDSRARQRQKYQDLVDAARLLEADDLPTALVDLRINLKLQLSTVLHDVYQQSSSPYLPACFIYAGCCKCPRGTCSGRSHVAARVFMCSSLKQFPCNLVCIREFDRRVLPCIPIRLLTFLPSSVKSRPSH